MFAWKKQIKHFENVKIILLCCVTFEYALPGASQVLLAQPWKHKKNVQLISTVQERYKTQQAE